MKKSQCLLIVRLNAVKVLKSTSVGRPFHALTTRCWKRNCKYQHFVV